MFILIKAEFYLDSFSGLAYDLEGRGGNHLDIFQGHQVKKKKSVKKSVCSMMTVCHLGMGSSKYLQRY